MPAPPIRFDAAALDLSPRVFHTTTVATSPAAGTIAAIASLTIPGVLALVKAVYLFGQASWTVGTNGVTGLLQIRQTGVSGTVVGTTGAATVVATNLVSQSVIGVDTGAVLPGQVYVLALTVGSGSAESTVGFVRLAALVV
jgi:hypothetical protein